MQPNICCVYVAIRKSEQFLNIYWVSGFYVFLLTLGANFGTHNKTYMLYYVLNLKRHKNVFVFSRFIFFSNNRNGRGFEYGVRST